MVVSVKNAIDEARIKAIIRRGQFEGGFEVIFKEIRILSNERKVFTNSQAVDLTKKEFDLLLYI